MNSGLTTFFNIAQTFALILPGLATLYIFVFAVAGLFYRQPDYPVAGRKRKIAVLIPGYKEDDVITEVANDALLQDYPQDSYDVIIIADSFKQETLDRLNKIPVKVVVVSFEKSTKAKALNQAMNTLPDYYDIAVVLDADNLMAQDFLSKINAFFENDCLAVQGHRAARNLNTPLAILDAVSEEINNHIFRRGHRVLRLSSALIGSGMAFRYKYFKDLMATVSAVGGFDKEIELKMLREGNKIYYLDDAYVYDEKVQKAETFTNQRRRWLAAQVKYFREQFMNSLSGLILKRNFDFFDKVMQWIQPPRVLLLGAMLIMTIIFVPLNVFIQHGSFYPALWLGILTACIMAFIFSVPRSYYNISTLKALAALPGGMLLMLKSLLRIKGADRQFLHTAHTATGSEKSNTEKNQP